MYILTNQYVLRLWIFISQAITVKRLTVNTRWRPTDAAGLETRRFWPNWPLPHRFYDFILSVGDHLKLHNLIHRLNPFRLDVMGENTYRHINSKSQSLLTVRDIHRNGLLTVSDNS